MTELIEYVTRRMELFDMQKLLLMQARTKALNDDLHELLKNQQEVKELAHDKKEIDQLYESCSNVKATMANMEKIVDRLESKRRVHDMCARVVLDVEALEAQQMQVLGSVAENRQLLEAVRAGISENVAALKRNVEFLKQKK